jgi:16S rRNA (guanine966-N2)-methyltransferase
MRITGGVFRSRLLRAPRGSATRPTSDRVREAVFAILGSRRSLDGNRVLDLYAGTGAFALEALSRGATHATLVESARPALDAVRANIESLDLIARAAVVAAPVERAGRAIAARAPFDLVFVDPPYALVPSGEASKALMDLVGDGILAPGAIVVLEHASADAAPALPALIAGETRRYGDTSVTLYFAGEAPPPSTPGP